MEDFDIAICATIAEHHPVSVEDVCAIYKTLDSFDATIDCIKLSLQHGLDPRSSANVIVAFEDNVLSKLKDL